MLSEFRMLFRSLSKRTVTLNVPSGACQCACYSDCMEMSVSGVQMDLEGAISKHKDISAHSCPSAGGIQKNF